MPSELCFPTFQSADLVQMAAASFSNPNQDDEDEDDNLNDDENHIERESESSRYLLLETCLFNFQTSDAFLLHLI